MEMAISDKIAYRLESNKPMDEVVANLERLTPEYQFRVLAIHDIQQALAEKGLDYQPLKIIEVCNAAFAHKALQKTIDVSLFIPCKFSVYTEGDKTIVALGRPTLITSMLPDSGL